MEILDPTNTQICEDYVHIYQTLSEDPDSNEQEWTPDGTRRELYATIFAACWYKEMYAPLTVDVRLTTTISTFRWDLSSKNLIITQRGPRFPAMVIDSGRRYYDYWSTELQTSFEQCRQLPIARARQVRLGSEPTPAAARQVFELLGLDLPGEYSDDDVRKIIDKALHERLQFTRGAGDNAAARFG